VLHPYRSPVFFAADDTFHVMQNMSSGCAGIGGVGHNPVLPGRQWFQLSTFLCIRGTSQTFPDFQSRKPFRLEYLPPGIDRGLAQAELFGNLLKRNPFLSQENYFTTLHHPQIIP
jgi:hypothetical protein